ncbi:MAG: hypothetical protein JWO05_2177 [Gemmatimonadetes bacterium]|nr:hypothetical protein [Gemmatimonadota bacterium]
MKRRDEVTVGILLTVAVSIAILGTLWLARGGLSSGYPLYARFAWGQNMKQGQQVLLAGVNVGYVDDVKLNDNGYLQVLLRINDDYKVPKSSTAAVRSVGFFGDVAIALTPKHASGPYFQPGDTVPPGLGEPTVGEVLQKVDSIGGSVQAITKALETEMVAQGGLRDLRKTIASTAQFSQQLSAMAAEQNRNMTLTLAEFRKSAAVASSPTVDSTIRNLRATSANFAQLTDSLKLASSKMNSLLSKLDSGQGTAGKLLTDTLLYADIRHTMQSVDSLLADFKKNPRKYINLRIF